MKSMIAVVVFFSAFFTLSPSMAAEAAPGKSALTADEQRQIDALKAAVAKTPEVKAATARFNAARKAYQAERAKFPAERQSESSANYRKAMKELAEVTRKAMLEANPGIAPLLEKADAAGKPAKRIMNEGETVADSDVGKNTAMRPVKDVAGLPRVLLVGDSISIGYTLQVREKLKGKANVHRIPINGGATEVGLAKMKEWLGDGRWDVIHFNFGLHDAKYQSATELRSSLDEYTANLRTLVQQMKATGAKLIFATTTPVPNGGVLTPTRRFDSIPRRNEVALAVMEKNGVAIDDLYAVVLPVAEKILRPTDVHYTAEGYETLATAVAASIESQLPKKQIP